MIDVNRFPGADDNERIENALRARGDEPVLLGRRVCDTEPERDWWKLDRAILLPENTTLILRNTKLKLSDESRDNFIRTANCGLGITEVAPLRNIHIRGEGTVILEGANRPRATGDGSKILANPCPKRREDLCRLADWVPEERRTPESIDFWDEHSHSFGTDAGKSGESQYSDWRGIGILFANCEDFTIEGLTIVGSHGWGISLEACSRGTLSRLSFDADMSRTVDGLLQNSENQDGIDLRNGCHHITLTDISGGTGDDLIALTAIADPHFLPAGSLCTTHVMANDWTKRERGIHDIIIRNVVGRCASGICCILRLLPCEARISNILIDGVLDDTPEGSENRCAIVLGEPDGAYGKNRKGDMTGIIITNVVTRSHFAIHLLGYLSDSVLSNVVNLNPESPVVYVARPDGMENVTLSGISTRGKELIRDNSAHREESWQ